MGLTIHYTLEHDGTVDSARGLLSRLRDRAARLRFELVGDIHEFAGDECDEGPRDEDEFWWLKIRGQRYLPYPPPHDPDRHATVIPTHMLALPLRPGNSEDSCMGFCKYPSKLRIEAKPVIVIPTQLGDGWSWQSSCKTQYASDPNHGGVDAFVECHTRLIHLLDYAQELGILKEVEDEGDYWKNRDITALRQTVERWNRMVAGFVGKMNDELEKNGLSRGKSAITEFPNFERLEAEGREVLGEDSEE